jgi:hypothetical protein
MPGTGTLAVEGTHLRKHGFWLLLGDEEQSLPFSEFPWFRQAAIDQFCGIEWPVPDHLYRPQLDVDLAVKSIRHPGRFLLTSKASADTALPGDAPQTARP